MKNIKDKPEHQKDHEIETPTPPQVMDPSELPENQSSDSEKKKSDGDKNKKKDKTKKGGGEGEPLTPNEEL